MSWWGILLNIGDKNSKPSTTVVTKQIQQKKVSACDEQKVFMHKNWDLFPDQVQDHIRRYDLIQSVMKEKDLHYGVLDSMEHRILRCTNMAKECQEVGFKPYGLRSILSEYESRLKESSLRLMDLPDLERLRAINYNIEGQMRAQGWVCSYGTGGLHWNKKGVVEDGYAKYD